MTKPNTPNEANHSTMTLACGHSNTFPRPAPAIGERVWCHTCRDYQETTAKKAVAPRAPKAPKARKAK